MFAIYKPHDLVDIAAHRRRWDDMAVRSGLPGLWWLAQADGEEDLDALDDVFDASFLNPSRLWTPVRTSMTRALGRVPHFFEGDALAPSLRGMLERHHAAVPCVLSGWDNTPRSGNRGWVMTGDSVRNLRAQLEVAREALGSGTRPDLLLVKSWNEWAEGNCLEPGGTWGMGHLDAVADAARLCAGSTTARST